MDEWNSFEILDPREAILLASLVPDSFFLKRSDDQTTDAYNIKLPLDFGDVWAADHLTVYPEVFEGDKKMVTFVKYWVPMWECDPGNVVRKKKERLRELDLFVRESGLEPADCLFVPYKEYRSGMQLGELLYHYVFGTIFKEMGYLVCNEFALAQYSGEKPDFCAFKTERIANALSQLRGEGVILGGSFLGGIATLRRIRKAAIQSQTAGFLRTNHGCRCSRCGGRKDARPESGQVAIAWLLARNSGIV